MKDRESRLEIFKTIITIIEAYYKMTQLFPTNINCAHGKSF